MGELTLFGTLVLLYVLYYGFRFLIRASRSTPGAQSATSSRQRRAVDELQSPPPAAVEQSPWGSPQDDEEGPKRVLEPLVTMRETDLPILEPKFRSVFPGGGSAFRFKTSDEIIRQAFGTLSTLEPRKPKE